MIENMAGETKSDTEKTTEKLKIKEKTKIFKKPFNFTKKAKTVKCEKITTGQKNSKQESTSHHSTLPFSNASDEELKKLGVIPEIKSRRIAEVIVKMPCKALNYFVKNLKDSFRCASPKSKVTNSSPKLLSYKPHDEQTTVDKLKPDTTTKKSYNEKATQIRTKTLPKDKIQASKSVGTIEKPKVADKSTDTEDLKLYLKLKLSKSTNKSLDIKCSEGKTDERSFKELFIMGGKFLYDITNYFIHSYVIKSEIFKLTYESMSHIKKVYLQSPKAFSTKPFSNIPFKERKHSLTRSLEKINRIEDEKDVKSEPIKSVSKEAKVFDSPLLKSPLEKILGVYSKETYNGSKPIQLKVFYGPLTKEETEALRSKDNENECFCEIFETPTNKKELCSSFEKMMENEKAEDKPKDISLAVMPCKYIYPGPIQFIKNICEKSIISETYAKLTKELENIFNLGKFKPDQKETQETENDQEDDKPKKKGPPTLPKPKVKRQYVPMGPLTYHEAMARKLHNDSINPPLIQRMNAKVCQDAKPFSLCDALSSAIKQFPYSLAKLGGGGKPCIVCGTTAYPAERVSSSKGTVHLQCFRCYQCKTLLNCGRWNTHENEYYCDPCHRKKALIVFR